MFRSGRVGSLSPTSLRPAARLSDNEIAAWIEREKAGG